MDNFKWTNKAKFVAYVDLVLAMVGMLVLIFNAIIIASISTPPPSNATIGRGLDAGDPVPAVMPPSIIHSHEIWSHFYSKTGSAVVLIMSILTALASVIAFVEIWAGIKLLKSTKIGREPKEALKMALLWRHVNFGFIALHVICFSGVITEWLPLKMFGTVFVGFILRIVFLYVVWQFIKELKGSLPPEDTEAAPDPISDEKKIKAKLDDM